MSKVRKKLFSMVKWMFFVFLIFFYFCRTSNGGGLYSPFDYGKYISNGYPRDSDQCSESETYSTYTDNSESTAIPMSSKRMRLSTTEASGVYGRDNNYCKTRPVPVPEWTIDHKIAAAGIMTGHCAPSTMVDAKGPGK